MHSCHRGPCSATDVVKSPLGDTEAGREPESGVPSRGRDLERTIRYQRMGILRISHARTKNLDWTTNQGGPHKEMRGHDERPAPARARVSFSSPLPRTVLVYLWLVQMVSPLSNRAEKRSTLLSHTLRIFFKFVGRATYRTFVCTVRYISNRYRLPYR